MDDSTKILFGIVIGAILISLSIYLGFQLLSETISGKFFFFFLLHNEEKIMIALESVLKLSK